MIPEHDPFEIAEPETVPEPHVHRPDLTNAPSAHTVIVAALAQRPDCPVCGSTEPCRCVRPEGYSVTEAHASLVEAALVHYGHLVGPEEQPEPFDPVETAQWLAERSGFPRYTQVEDGWKRLLESEPDVEVAAVYAGRRAPTGDIEMVKAAKAALLDWHERQRKAAAKPV